VCVGSLRGREFECGSCHGFILDCMGLGRDSESFAEWFATFGTTYGLIG
jgi:hypothetical protein